MYSLLSTSYGFQHAITPADILLAHPSIWPFARPFLDHYRTFARPLPQPLVTTRLPSSSLPTLSPSTNLQISSILVFNDPRDWGLDATIILDLLLSHRGFLGTRSPLLPSPDLPNHGYQQDGQPSLWYSNPDLLWASSYHQPRLGQGGFRESFEGLWKSITTSASSPHGIPLQKRIIGKPYFETYSFADKILNNYRKHLLSQSPSPSSNSTPPNGASAELERVYMLGDNPASDIRGANDYRSPNSKTEWMSILLRSGVFDETEGPPAYEPRVIKDGVSEGVEWALRREGWPSLN